jgi:hypothetical protein
MLGRGLAKRSPERCARSMPISPANCAMLQTARPIEDVESALAHAQRTGRNGKVLILPNGPPA